MLEADVADLAEAVARGEEGAARGEQELHMLEQQVQAAEAELEQVRVVRRRRCLFVFLATVAIVKQVQVLPHLLPHPRSLPGSRAHRPRRR